MLSRGLTERAADTGLPRPPPLGLGGVGSRGKLSVIEVHPAAPFPQLQAHFFSSPVCSGLILSAPSPRKIPS